MNLPDADVSLSPSGRLLWDLRGAAQCEKFESYWATRHTQLIPREIFSRSDVNLEIGAGTGMFITGLARAYPEKTFVAVERYRMRAKRLVRKTRKAELPNLLGLRGNAVPAIIHGIPTASVDRLYVLYPCPFPKASQRKNRWYLHPAMPHFVRVLKPGGVIVLASDQKFYVDEASYVCEHRFQLSELKHGVLSPHEYNELALFPQGRSKFERTFLAAGLPCYELIAQKP